MSNENTIIRQIPNLITLLNLCAGSLAVIFTFENNIRSASYLILMAAFLDFMDGFVARLLNAKTEIGKYLDSLADVISFGMAPAVIIFQMMNQSFHVDNPEFSIHAATFTERLLLFSPVLLIIFSAIRLARFNLSHDEKYFSGLPTPATAIFISGIALVAVNPDTLLNSVYLTNKITLLSIILIFSFLMISNLQLFSLKFPSFSLRTNLTKYAFLLISVMILIILKESAIPVIIIFYILLSAVINRIIKLK